MKIVVWGINAPETGLGQQTARVAAALRKIGKVFVLNYGNKRSDIDSGVLDTQHCDIGYMQGILKTADLIVSVGDLWNCIQIAEIMPYAQAPWVAFYGVEGETFPIRGFAKNSIVNIASIVQRVDYHLVFSTHARDIMGQLSNNPIDVLPPFVVPLTSPPTDWHDVFGIPLDKKIALFVGENISRKGLPYLLLIAEKIREKYHTVIHCHRRYSEIGIDLEMACARKNYITLNSIVYDKNVVNMYAGADVFVSPHMAEGFGMCIAEAAAAGCKILATDQGGVRDYLPQGCLVTPLSYNYYLQAGGVGYNAALPDVDVFAERLLDESSLIGCDFKNDWGQFEAKIINVAKKAQKRHWYQ
jgi:glycosyltransferase involved in cell wall biosynthesis